MYIKELFTEGLSKVIYHYVHLEDAIEILKTGKFDLDIALGNSDEEKFAPKGHQYFLSTTRTRLGSFHATPRHGGVIFELDGSYYANKYKAKPVDFFALDTNKRNTEAEDRIFSKTPTLSIDGVKNLHMFIDLTSKHPASENEMIKNVIGYSLKLGLPIKFYIDVQSWRLLKPTNMNYNDILNHLNSNQVHASDAVSYTHLTLPTKRIV